MKNRRGLFITIEGIEGVGKSVNIAHIAKAIRQHGESVLLTREPGGTPIAEAIRQVLLAHYDETMHAKTELLLFYAGRLQHVEEKIKPALAEGTWVVSDRFTDATFAYQGAGRGMSYEDITQIHHWTLGDFTPDCTLILDAPVDVAFARIEHERSLDRFEQEQKSFFEKIRQSYLSMAERDQYRYQVIDASKPLSEVKQDLGAAILQLMERVR